MSDHLVSEALYFSDPDGLGIEVYADRPRDTWHRQADGQLEMDTRPLQTKSVMATGAGRAWQGAPAGTAMGHVHLHVGDLAAARSFYVEGVGLTPTQWSYPGALFLAAGGYHHHLGTNTWSRGGAASDDQARLLQWELRVPSRADVEALGVRLRAAGYEATMTAAGCTARDPWGTRVDAVAE